MPKKAVVPGGLIEDVIKKMQDRQQLVDDTLKALKQSHEQATDTLKVTKDMMLKLSATVDTLNKDYAALKDELKRIKENRWLKLFGV